MNDLTNIQENFPYLSGIRYLDNEYVGIIQNSDDKIVSFYDYNVIKTPEAQKKFLKLGDIWWWESNRQVPINIFLRNEIQQFAYTIRNFTSKDVRVLHGPVTSLNNIIIKRIKRKSITLVRKPS